MFLSARELLILGVSIFSSGAHAQDAYFKKLSAMAPMEDFVTAPSKEESKMKEVIAKSEKGRSPAQQNMVGEEKMSAEFRKIRDEFLAVKTSDDLAGLLYTLEQKYDSLPKDAQFFAAQVIPAKVLRGVVYRMRNMFETRSKAVHSAVLTTAKDSVTNFHIYLPQQNMKAVQEYLLSPFFVNGKVIESFKDEADLQAFLAFSLRREIQKADGRLAKLTLSEPVIWDQRLSFGPDSFQDGIGRFRLIGEFEKTLVRSAMMSAVATFSALRAYNVGQSIDMSKNIGRLYGIDGFLGPVDGVSAMKISREIRKFKTAGVLLPDGAQWMKQALNASRWSMSHAYNAWKASNDSRRHENLYAVDTGYWRVNRADIEQNIENTYQVVMSDKAEKVRSSVTGEIIEMNYAKFFNEPPQDLKALLPVGFDERTLVTRQALVDETGKRAPLSYRNYAEGRPEVWNTAEYTKYFPHVKQNEDVTKTMRVLSHAGGNWLSVIR